MSLFTKIITFERPDTLLTSGQFMRFVTDAPNVMRWYRHDETHNREWLEWSQRTKSEESESKPTALRFPFHRFDHIEAVRKHRRMKRRSRGLRGRETLRTNAKLPAGSHQEQDFDLQEFLRGLPGYRLRARKGKEEFGKYVFYRDKMVAMCFQKGEFFCFLDDIGVEWKSILSRKLLLDDALLVIVREVLFIIEVKFQRVEGSVDEKLQTCDFKRKQYAKLVKSLGLKVEYVYVLNDWFKNPRYKDVLDYIDSVNCHYRFNSIPLAWLGLPVPEQPDTK